MAGDGNDTRSLGEANKRLILNAVRERGAATVEELVRGTGRSQPTVLKWLGELEGEGFLQRGGHGRSTGGRRPILYRFAADRGFLLGLAVEIPEARLTLVDLRGHEVDSTAWQLDIGGGAATLLDDLVARARAFARSHGDAGRDVLGAGLALSGFIDRDAGLSLASPRLAGWQDVPVRDALARGLDVPVTLHHHIDAMTLAETCFGAAVDLRDFLYFDVGHGLGIRAVRGGEHVHGRFGNAGLIGHTTVVPDGRPCLCGNRGCLEEYVSGRALLRDEARIAARPVGPASERIEAVGERLFSAARAGNEAEGAVVRTLCHYLSIGVANAINLFDVPHVVLSGFVRAGGERLRGDLQEATRARLQATLARHTRIVFADIPRSRAAGHGAALFALADRFPYADPLVARGEAAREEVSAAPS